MPDIVYLSLVRQPTDGTTTVWEFSFAGGYLDRDYVRAALIDVVAETREPVDFQWVGNNQILIEPALPAGYVLEIYRDTYKDNPLVDYTDGSILNETNLNKNAIQAIHAIAELTDRAADVNQNASDAAAAALLAAERAEAALDDANAAKQAALDAAARAEEAATNSEAETLRQQLASVNYGAKTVAVSRTPAVPSTVQDRLNAMYINVKDFGAIGDGVADDTQAIRDAIAAADATTGVRVVFFPAGVYGISARISLRSNLRIVGNRDAFIVPLSTFPTGQGNLLYAGKVQNTHIRGLGFDLQGRRDTGVCWADGCTRFSMRHCIAMSTQIIGEDIVNIRSVVQVTGTSSDIVVSDNVSSGIINFIWVRGTGVRLFIERNTLSGLGTFSILLSEATVFWSMVRIRDNYIDGDGSRRSLIYIGALSGNQALTGYHDNVIVADNLGIGSDLPYVDSPTYQGNGDLFSLRGMMNGRVTGNFAIGGGDLGIVIEHSKNIAVSDNIAARNEISGIVLHKAENCTVTNNIAFDNCMNRNGNGTNRSERAGIRVMAGSRNCILVGNRCYDTRIGNQKTQLWGIFVSSQGESTAGQTGRDIHIGTNHLNENKLGTIAYTPGMTVPPYLDHQITGGGNLPNSMYPTGTVFKHGSVGTGFPFLSVVNNTGIKTAPNGANPGDTTLTLSDVTGISVYSRLGIVTGQGTIQFLAVTGATGNTVTLSGPINTSGVAAGADVFYTNWRTAVTYAAI